MTSDITCEPSRYLYGIPDRFVTDAEGRRWACFKPDTVAVTASAAQEAYATQLRESAGLAAAVTLSPGARSALVRHKERRRAELRAEKEEAARRVHLTTCTNGALCPDCVT